MNELKESENVFAFCHFIHNSSPLFDLWRQTEKWDLRHLYFLCLIVSFGSEVIREHISGAPASFPRQPAFFFLSVLPFFHSFSENRCRPGVWRAVPHLTFICAGCLYWSPAYTLRQIVVLMKVSLKHAFSFMFASPTLTSMWPITCCPHRCSVDPYSSASVLRFCALAFKQSRQKK